MRPIDADKLQKAIPAEEDNITGMGMTYDEMEAYNDGIDEQWKKIVNAPTIESEQRWILCSERLPEQYGNYLISIDGKEPDIGTINPNDPRGWGLCDANGFYWANDRALNITAWMPLPAEYKEGREG